MESSPLVTKYHQALEQNPKSKVFAPLGDLYRKMGMMSEAVDLLRKGLRVHPDYVYGYVSLASCYFDQEKYELCYTTLKPLISRHRDNLRLHHLFADSCLRLGFDEEALDTFKYLLFLNPKNEKAGEEVQRLEGELKEEVITQASHPKFEADSLLQEDETEMEWEQVSLEDEPQVVKEKENFEFIDLSQVTLEEGPEDPLPLVSDQEEVSLNPHPQELFSTDSAVMESEPEEEEEETQEEASSGPEERDEQEPQDFEENPPFMTLTLVDLYEEQGLFRKAIDVLSKIKEVYPGNTEIAERMESVKKKLFSDSTEGHQDLMRSYDERVISDEAELETEGPKGEDLHRLEKAYQSFLSQIKERAQLHH